MTSVDFFIPLTFQNQSTTFKENIIELVDDYFYIGGKKAYVIHEHLDENLRGAFINNETQQLWVTALKIASWFTLAIPLMAISLKFFLRRSYNIVVVEPHELFKEGIDIGDDIYEKLKLLIPIIKAQKEHPDVVSEVEGGIISFRLKSIPDLCFKIPLIESSRSSFLENYENMTLAYSTVLSYNLDLLKLANSRLLQTDFGPVIAEQYFLINSDEKQQEINYQSLRGLSGAIKQLAYFFIKAPFNDVNLSNLVVLDDEPGFDGKRRILLRNLKQSCSLKDPLINFASRLLKKEQIDFCYKEAKEQSIPCIEQLKELVMQRNREYDQESPLFAYYQSKGILESPRKFISIDSLDDLELNLNESKVFHANISPQEGIRFTLKTSKCKIYLKQAILETIRRINESILKATSGESLKSRRLVFIDKVGVSWTDFKHPHAILQDDWLEKILVKLVEKRYLYKIERQTDEGFYVQA